MLRINHLKKERPINFQTIKILYYINILNIHDTSKYHIIALTDNKRIIHIYKNLIKAEPVSLNTSIFQGIHAAREFMIKKNTSAPRNN